MIRKGAERSMFEWNSLIVWLIMVDCSKFILNPSWSNAISVANASIQSLCPEFVIQEILRKAGHDVLVTSGGPDSPRVQMSSLYQATNDPIEKENRI